MKLNVDDLDFNKCEDEKIHIPESIQSYGYLFALDEEDYTIRLISENVKTLLSGFGDIIGKPFLDLLEKELIDIDFLKETYQRAKERQTRLPLKIRFRKKYLNKDSETYFYVVIYNSDNYCVIELEPAGKFRETYSARHFMKLYGMSIAPKFREYTSLDQLAQNIVDTIKDISGMERVVLYRFNEDSSGKVIAEAKEEDMESYLHLNYPASDIPPQARELYKRNWVRLIPNVDLESSKLIPEPGVDGRKPLDMTQSILRSMSPIHLQYVRNQGLKASMSMSLVTHENLWGIISCHSREAKYVPQNVRLECENLSQLFSWHLYAKEEEFYIDKRNRTDKAIDNLLKSNPIEKSIVEIFEKNEKEVLNLLDADGFMFYTKDETITLGKTPSLEVVLEITQQAGISSQHHYSNRNLTELVDEPKLNGIRGVMLITLLEENNYFTAWFRKEHKEVQRWVGVEDEKSINTSKKHRLQPRTSFKVNEVVIEGQSSKWEQRELDIAERFNKVFMAYALSTHESMRQDISDLRIQDKYKDEFLATLAHELRNPLSPILAGISLIQGGMEEEEQTPILKMMERQVDHMSTMINDLMEVSRITRGKVKLEPEAVPLQEVIQNAVQTSQTVVSEKNHELNVELPDEELFILGDRTRLSQIFVNILNNAAKYTPPEGKIEIKVEKKDKMLSVNISDNGIGISEENIDSIFNMFTQMDSHEAHYSSGLGIGLTLVKKLVLLHNGDIRAHSEGKGKGSKFTVLLPMANTGSYSSSANGSFNGNKEEEQEQKKKKVLVVDDNLDILTTYRMLLMKEGFDVHLASNGKEAINKFKHFKPQFALLDIGMPDISGYDLVRELKKLPESENTVFFSQSGWGNKEHVEKSREAGFKAHFVKPLKIKKLREILSEI